jgi:hypothetical protein
MSWKSTPALEWPERALAWERQVATVVPAVRAGPAVRAAEAVVPRGKTPREMR